MNMMSQISVSHLNLLQAFQENTCFPRLNGNHDVLGIVVIPSKHKCIIDLDRQLI